MKFMELACVTKAKELFSKVMYFTISYHCLSDNQQSLGATIDEGGGLPLGQVFWWRGTTSGICNMYMHML